MLKVFNDFERRPDLLARFDALLPTYSISCIFADVMYRQNVMHSAIKPAFKAKVTGQAITVQLSGGDLVDPLRALEADNRQAAADLRQEAPKYYSATRVDALLGEARPSGHGLVLRLSLETAAAPAPADEAGVLARLLADSQAVAAQMREHSASVRM